MKQMASHSLLVKRQGGISANSFGMKTNKDVIQIEGSGQTQPNEFLNAIM